MTTDNTGGSLPPRASHGFPNGIASTGARGAPHIKTLIKGSVHVTKLITQRLLWNVDEEGQGRGMVRAPTDVAFHPSRHIVVSEGDNCRLQIFDFGGKSIRTIEDTSLEPRGVTVDSRNGRILVVDSKENTVKFYSLTGQRLGTLGSQLFGNPSGIALTIEGNIVVTDTDATRAKVSIYSPEGMLIRAFGSCSPGDEECMATPDYVTVDHYNRILVSDAGTNSIKTFDGTGSLISSIQGRLDNPKGVFADAMDNILVADNGNHRISLYSGTSGRLVQHVLTQRDSLYWPQGLAVCDGGPMAITENGSSCHKVKLYQM